MVSFGRFRVSLRSLVAAGAIFCIVLAWGAIECRRAYVQHELLLAIAPYGDPTFGVSRWFGKLPFVVNISSNNSLQSIWEEFGRTITGVTLTRQPVSDDALDALGRLPALDSLALVDISLTKQIVNRLQAAPSIRELKLARCLFSDEAMIAVSRVDHLRSLVIIGSQGPSELQASALASASKIENLEIGTFQISDETFQRLMSLAQLNSLTVSGMSLSKPDLQAIGRVTNLRTLTFNQVNTPPDGMRPLGRLCGLRSLELYSMPVDTIDLCELPQSLTVLVLHGAVLAPEALDCILSLRKIAKLRIEVNGMPGQAVLALAQLPDLRQLVLDDDGLSSEALDRIRHAIPNCSIIRNAREYATSLNIE